MSRGLTRRQAVPKAIELLKCLPQTEEVVAVIQALEKYYATPLARWDVPSVYEALEEWSKKHEGKAPSTKDCDLCKDLPSHGVFEKLFHKSAKEFLNEYYGELEYVRIGKCKTVCINDQYDFLEIFKKEFERIKPRTSKIYDVRRNPNTPSWKTIASRCEIASWSELVTLAGVEASCLQRQYNSYRIENNLVTEHKKNEQVVAEYEKQKKAESEFDKLIERTDRVIKQAQKNCVDIVNTEKTRTIQIGRK